MTFWEIMTMGMKPYDGLDEYGILKRIKEGYRLPQRSAGWMIPNEVHFLRYKLCVCVCVCMCFCIYVCVCVWLTTFVAVLQSDAGLLEHRSHQAPELAGNT